MRTLTVARMVHNNPSQTQLKDILEMSMRDPINIGQLKFLMIKRDMEFLFKV